MSRKRPYTPTATAAVPDAPEPTPAACGGCRHWLPAGDHQGKPVGRCVSAPPAIPGGPTAFGPLCLYPLTTADTPACGRFDPS